MKKPPARVRESCVTKIDPAGKTKEPQITQIYADYKQIASQKKKQKIENCLEIFIYLLISIYFFNLRNLRFL